MTRDCTQLWGPAVAQIASRKRGWTRESPLLVTTVSAQDSFLEGKTVRVMPSTVARGCHFPLLRVVYDARSTRNGFRAIMRLAGQ